MLKDAENEFSSKQVITSTARSTNVIKLGPTGTPVGASQALTRDIAGGKTIPILCQVVEDFATGDAATLKVDLETDDDEAFGSAKNVYASAVIAAATLVVGYEFLIDWIPKGTDEDYLSLNYTVGTGTFTAGKIDAAIVAARQGGIGS